MVRSIAFEEQSLKTIHKGYERRNNQFYAEQPQVRMACEQKKPARWEPRHKRVDRTSRNGSSSVMLIMVKQELLLPKWDQGWRTHLDHGTLSFFAVPSLPYISKSYPRCFQSQPTRKPGTVSILHSPPSVLLCPPKMLGNIPAGHSVRLCFYIWQMRVRMMNLTILDWIPEVECCLMPNILLMLLNELQKVF